MKKNKLTTVILAGLLVAPFAATAQYKDSKAVVQDSKTEAELLLEKAESAE